MLKNKGWGKMTDKTRSSHNSLRIAYSSTHFLREPVLVTKTLKLCNLNIYWFVPIRINMCNQRRLFLDKSRGNRSDSIPVFLRRKNVVGKKSDARFCPFPFQTFLLPSLQNYSEATGNESGNSLLIGKPNSAESGKFLVTWGVRKVFNVLPTATEMCVFKQMKIFK